MTGLSRALRVAFIAGLASCGGSERRAVEDAAAPAAVQAEAVQFIAWHESVVKPLEKAIAEAWWNANTSGRDADFKAKEAAENELDAVLADRARARRLEKIHDDIAAAGGRIDPLVARQIELLRLQYLEKQLDPELLKRLAAKANAIEQVFNVYRAKVDGKELTDSQVRKILKESRDPAERKAVWEAGKAVGAAVQADLRELVRLRNEAARALGFQDYHRMQLTLGEQDPEQVLALFDELHDLTREPLIGNLQFMEQSPYEEDRHNARLYRWCYRRPADFIRQLVHEGAQEIDSSGYAGFDPLGQYLVFSAKVDSSVVADLGELVNTLRRSGELEAITGAYFNKEPSRRVTSPRQKPDF